MRVGIWNLEPRLRNYALDKVEIYHQQRGDFIEHNIFMGKYDKVYCSAIFDWTPSSKKYKGLPYHLVDTGGTGFDLSSKLPSEIEEIVPHKNYGFTTRGCIRNCPFCVVPRKEGKIKVVGDLLSLWDGKANEIILYDNNILALPSHFEKVCAQARANKIKLDFNQGLDARLLSPEMVDILKSIRHYEYRFAFDDWCLINNVEYAIRLLQSKRINRCSWYDLTGFNSTLEDDLMRLNYLRDNNQIAYLQRYKGKVKPKIKRNKTELMMLARWVNQHRIFRGMNWKQFLAHPDNRRYKLEEMGE